ncbi:MAG: hypothetical protein SGILL_003878 [Bacillariaceae sp.]
MLQIFDVARPGRHPMLTIKLGKTRRSKDGQKGLVSSLAHNGATGLCAIGTVSPGSIYLYDVRTYCRTPAAEIIASTAASTTSTQTTCVVGHGKGRRKRLGGKRKHFHMDDDEGSGDDEDNVLNFAAAKQNWYQQKAQTGVTQLEFLSSEHSDSGSDSHYLFSTSRRSGAILQWDLRKLSNSTFCPGVASFEIENETNQRIEFQLHGDKLWTGGKDGCVRVYDVTSGEQEALLHPCGDNENRDCQGVIDAVNGVSVCTNPTTGRALLATAIGSRHFPADADWENDDPYDKGNGGNCTATANADGSESLHVFAVHDGV